MSEKVKTILGKVGLSPKGEWKASNKYERLDVVSYSGASFLSLSDENDALLTDASKWMVVAQKGDKGDTGDYYEFRVSGNKLQLKLNRSEETEWKDLFDISTLNGKTPVLNTVTVTNGSTPSGVFTKTGEDASGNPEYKLTLTVQAGKDGQPPVFVQGTTTTISSDQDASVEVVADGETPEGNPRYKLNFFVPRGEKGQDGTGSGNVYVKTDNLQVGKKYVFVPDQNNSANGKFEELGGIGYEIYQAT